MTTAEAEPGCGEALLDDGSDLSGLLLPDKLSTEVAERFVAHTDWAASRSLSAGDWSSVGRGMNFLDSGFAMVLDFGGIKGGKAPPPISRFDMLRTIWLALCRRTRISSMRAAIVTREE